MRSLGWGVGSSWLFSSLLPMLTVLGGSFEGVHTEDHRRVGFLQWLTLIGGDALSAYTISGATQGVNDFFLSLVHADQPDRRQTARRRWATTCARPTGSAPTR